jgi:hypothetical protein
MNSDLVIPLIVILLGLAVFVWGFRRMWRSMTHRGVYDEEYRQNCGYDVRASIGRCPECGLAIPSRVQEWFPLRDEWPETFVDPRKPGADELPTVVRTTKNGLEADLMCQQLNARGMNCRVVVRPVSYGRTHVDYLDLVVWSADADVARELLDRLMARSVVAERR